MKVNMTLLVTISISWALFFSIGAAANDAKCEGMGGILSKTIGYLGRPADVLTFINVVNSERNPTNRPLNIFEKIGIVDTGYRRYLEIFGATLEDEGKHLLRQFYDRPLTIFEQIKYIKAVFPQTPQNELEQLEKVGNIRSQDSIKRLDM